MCNGEHSMRREEGGYQPDDELRKGYQPEAGERMPLKDDRLPEGGSDIVRPEDNQSK